MTTDSPTLQRVRAHAASCYHCGLPVPAGARHRVVIGGRARDMCCAGCAAVAGAIVGSGLESYYEKRDRFPESPREALPDIVGDPRVFDNPEVQAGFVAEPAEHEREAALILEGITCPACIWLNESHLCRQPGVKAVHINYATRRATVRWDARLTSLSAILASIRAIGYRAHPYDACALEAAQKRESRGLLARLAIAALAMMQVMMYAVPAYIASAGSMPSDVSSLMRWASLVLTVPVVFYSASGFFSAAWRDLRARRLGMDVPVAAAIAVAFLASVRSTLAGAGEVYFDSLTMFVFLLLGARYLELRARQKAAAYLEALARAAPAVANRLLNFPLCLNFETVGAGSLVAGDHVLVRPGETFPADGRIEQGDTETDESLLTGESRPVRKHEGDSVVGGAVNRAHPVVVRVERVGEQTILSAIVRLTERAAHARPRLQEIADRVAVRFTAGVLATALAAGLWWLLHDARQAAPVVIAVLVVTCPCALALATPMALAVATSEMARRGLLVTRGHALEVLARADCFVLDKTGTLTVGHPVLQNVRLLRGSREEALMLAGALERSSEHPLARAICAVARDAPAATQLRSAPGHGVEGVVAGRRLRVGNARFVAELAGDSTGVPAPEAGEQSVWLGDEEGPIAAFGFSDALRPDAAAFVQRVRSLGARVFLLSGDAQSSVRATARTVGIDEWKAAQSPQDKQAFVKALQAEGATVAMVGDGVNDAPVLAQAQVSIALMSGAALAQGAADMVLLSGRLLDLAQGMQYARRTLRIVRQNLGWAMAYNVVAIPLAVTGSVTPWIAGIGMAGSSMLVVLNALRLARPGRKHPLLAFGD
ncbi:MAG TPA: heavy metal translocating P-type ATPase [Burkholderiales bacterium]|nr:heavy metal translocating P-type ATPase [Burkholderiales bacterium]